MRSNQPAAVRGLTALPTNIIICPDDSNWPPDHAELDGAPFRNQFNGLKTLIDAQATLLSLSPAIAGRWKCLTCRRSLENIMLIFHGKLIMKTHWVKLMVIGAGLLLSGVVHAQYTFTTNNGAITITGFTGSGNVTIPSSTNGYPVTIIGTNAFLSCNTLTNVVIPNSVTNIGDYAFGYCYRMTNATLGNGVISIGANGFYFCTNLNNVTIPASVTSIGDNSFGSCSVLTNIGVVGANTYFTNSGGVLFNKTMTTLVQYPGGLGGSYTISNSVTKIGNYAFGNCQNLTGITIGTNVAIIGNKAFQYCSSLSSVTIPSSVTNISPDAFIYCYGLTSFSVNAANPSYTSADGVLFNKAMTALVVCPGGLPLYNYVISNTVVSIGASAFQGNSGPTSITIPTNVTSIGDLAFVNCFRLTSVTIAASVTNIGNSAFLSCSALTSIAVDANNLSCASAGGVFERVHFTGPLIC